MFSGSICCHSELADSVPRFNIWYAPSLMQQNSCVMFSWCCGEVQQPKSGVMYSCSEAYVVDLFCLLLTWRYRSIYFLDFYNAAFSKNIQPLRKELFEFYWIDRLCKNGLILASFSLPKSNRFC